MNRKMLELFVRFISHTLERRFVMNRKMLGLFVLVVVALVVATARADTIGYWSFEEAGPFGPAYTADVINDNSANDNDLDWTSNGSYTYQSSTDVPPSSMFATG